MWQVKDLYVLAEEAARGAKYDTFGSLDCISLLKNISETSEINWPNCVF